jgi:hypothetical protein
MSQTPKLWVFLSGQQLKGGLKMLEGLSDVGAPLSTAPFPISLRQESVDLRQRTRSAPSPRQTRRSLQIPDTMLDIPQTTPLNAIQVGAP